MLSPAPPLPRLWFEACLCSLTRNQYNSRKDKDASDPKKDSDETHVSIRFAIESNKED